MSNENQESQTLKVLASTKLTQEQIELFVVKALMEDSKELAEAVDGKQVEEKGLPAGGVDKRGSTVMPAKAKAKKDETNEEF